MENKGMQFFRMFSHVCKLINSTLSLNEVLKLITENVVKALNAKACTIFLLDTKNKKLEVGASYGVSETYLKKGPLDADKSIAESLKGKPVLVYDAAKDPQTQYPEEAKKEGIASILSVPIPVQGKVIGVLRIYTPQPRKFSDDENEFVSGLAEMGGIAIVNAMTYERLKEDSQGLMDDTWKWFETMLPNPTS